MTVTLVPVPVVEHYEETERPHMVKLSAWLQKQANYTHTHSRTDLLITRSHTNFALNICQAITHTHPLIPDIPLCPAVRIQCVIFFCFSHSVDLAQTNSSPMGPSNESHTVWSSVCSSSSVYAGLSGPSNTAYTHGASVTIATTSYNYLQSAPPW